MYVGVKPGNGYVAVVKRARLTNLLYEASHGRYNRDKSVEIRDAARLSIGSVMPAKTLELKHTIALIGILSEEIDEIEVEIKAIMDEINSPILTIPASDLLWVQ